MMEAHLRAALAYIAGRLVSRTKACGVYDHSRFRQVIMDGTVKGPMVAIYDHDQLCHISGSGNGLQYILFHHGKHRPVCLTLEGSGFCGHDYGRSTRFRGSVEGDFISVCEDGTARQFGYTLMVSLEPPWSDLADETGIEPDQPDPGSQTA